MRENATIARVSSNAFVISNNDRHSIWQYIARFGCHKAIAAFPYASVDPRVESAYMKRNLGYRVIARQLVYVSCRNLYPQIGKTRLPNNEV